jgi:hypothetical protein
MKLQIDTHIMNMLLTLQGHLMDHCVSTGNVSYSYPWRYLAVYANLLYLSSCCYRKALLRRETSTDTVQLGRDLQQCADLHFS